MTAHQSGFFPAGIPLQALTIAQAARVSGVLLTREPLQDEPGIKDPGAWSSRRFDAEEPEERAETGGTIRGDK